MIHRVFGNYQINEHQMLFFKASCPLSFTWRIFKALDFKWQLKIYNNHIIVSLFKKIYSYIVFSRNCGCWSSQIKCTSAMLRVKPNSNDTQWYSMLLKVKVQKVHFCVDKLISEHSDSFFRSLPKMCGHLNEYARSTFSLGKNPHFNIEKITFLYFSCLLHHLWSHFNICSLVFTFWG